MSLVELRLDEPNLKLSGGSLYCVQYSYGVNMRSSWDPDDRRHSRMEGQVGRLEGLWYLAGGMEWKWQLYLVVWNGNGSYIGSMEWKWQLLVSH